jgi:hypothetical protein
MFNPESARNNPNHADFALVMNRAATSDEQMFNSRI